MSRHLSGHSRDQKEKGTILSRRGVTYHWRLLLDIQSASKSVQGAFGLLFIEVLCADKASQSSCLWFLCRPGMWLLNLLLGSLALPGALLEWNSCQDDLWLGNIFRVHVLFLGKNVFALLLVTNLSGFVLLLALKSHNSGDLSVLDKLGWPLTLEYMDPKQPQHPILRLFQCESNIHSHAHQTLETHTKPLSVFCEALMLGVRHRGSVYSHLPWNERTEHNSQRKPVFSQHFQVP